MTSSMGTFVHGGKTEGEDHAVTILNFDGGQMAVIESSWAKGGGVDDRLEIYGTKGHTRADLVFGNALADLVVGGICTPAPRKPDRPRVGAIPGFDDLWNGGYLQEMRYFVDCILRDEPAWIDGRVGRMRSKRSMRPIVQPASAPPCGFLSVCRKEPGGRSISG